MKNYLLKSRMGKLLYYGVRILFVGSIFGIVMLFSYLYILVFSMLNRELGSPSDNFSKKN